MSNRHLSRTIAMQTLYEWDFNHRSQKLKELIEKNTQENMVGDDRDEFVEILVRGVTKNLDKIDEKIQKYAPEWPIDKITIVDRNVLRLGLYEMLYQKEVPEKVIINEAIEMAKAFGGSSSGKFVNGVLGAVLIDLEKTNKN
ncbi:transcription antitermination factor NusB [Candidatus Parcubacteria bacterium]|nr:transcription antitermination factor NusB [Patescibacteria group bacterium]MBU4482279.1 transcription antitermination factor NusB [Patescibacteria group bacterium]MCG2686881.1 transcription antitermination factor NusB [Candidatus Parcubacteria bacterium]